MCVYETHTIPRQLILGAVDPAALPPVNNTCAKDLETAQRYKNEGNAAFRASSFHQALDLYTKAIRYNPFYSAANKMNLATLLVNGAAALHALGQLMAATRDCTRATGIHPEYSKAWYRLGGAWAGLKWYEQAIKDLEQALFYEVSANGRKDMFHELARVRILMAAGDREFLDMDCGAGPKPWRLGEFVSHEEVSPIWTFEKIGICKGQTKSKLAH